MRIFPRLTFCWEYPANLILTWKNRKNLDAGIYLPLMVLVLAGRLNAKTLSEHVGLSLRRVTDIFKQAYGMTPKEYADLLRLRTAKKLIAHTDKKIIDIAYLIVFSNLTAFNRFF